MLTKLDLGWRGRGAIGSFVLPSDQSPREKTVLQPSLLLITFRLMHHCVHVDLGGCWQKRGLVRPIIAPKVSILWWKEAVPLSAVSALLFKDSLNFAAKSQQTMQGGEKSIIISSPLLMRGGPLE